MKKLVQLILFACLFTASQAQLVNNGATIFIQPGGYLFSSGAVDNASGTLTNNGKLEVQGNFSNAGTYNTTTADDSLILSGAGNVTVNTGGSVVSNLTINKATAADQVRLTASATVSTKLDYTQGQFTTDPTTAFVLSSPATAVYSFAAGKEIIGTVERTAWTAGTARIFNQPNMTVATNTGTAPSSFRVTMIPNGDPSLAEREVKRKFVFSQTGGTGFTADIKYPYLDAEAAPNNTEAGLVPWKLIGGEWNSAITGITKDATNNFVSITGIPGADVTTANEWKLADSKYTFNVTANLRGSWSSTTMLTTLNSSGLLPLSQPYTNVTPWFYTGTEAVASVPNANIVDWILLELRKPSTGLASDALSSTIIGRKAGFLLANGTIVDTDGSTPLAFDISKQGNNCFVVVRHRNHLPVISNGIPSNTAGNFTNDFSILANSYLPAGAPSDPVVLLPGATGKYGLWAGDANKTQTLSASDISAIKLGVANGATGYLLTDTNLTGAVSATDLSLTKGTIAGAGTTTTPGRTIVVKTNLPDVPELEN